MATVLFDADCGICTALAAWLVRHGRDVEAEAIQSPAGALWLRDLSPTARLAAFHAIDDLGRRRSGGAAVPLALRGLPAGRELERIATLLAPLVERGYRLLARHRMAVSRVLGLAACDVSQRAEPRGEIEPSPVTMPTRSRDSSGTASRVA